MLQLSRTVRFCLGGAGRQAPRHNTFSAWPPMRGLGRYYEAHVLCQGEPDPLTGYFINIKHIDEAFRQRVLPYLEDELDRDPAGGSIALGALLRRSLGLLQEPLAGQVIKLGLQLTPYYRLEMERSAMATVLIRQQYEFAAAHRLHVPTLSAAENLGIFGKCNNPSGHGHNYRVEVVVRATIDAAGALLPVEALDELVDELVIQQLDHKHLNVDVPQFAGRNSSVENIAQVIYHMLGDEVSRRLAVKLEEVSVWETSKTVCTYAGQ